MDAGGQGILCDVEQEYLAVVALFSCNSCCGPETMSWMQEGKAFYATLNKNTYLLWLCFPVTVVVAARLYIMNAGG